MASATMTRVSHTHRLSILWRWAIMLALIAVFLPTRGAEAQTVDPNWSPPRTVYIPETGHSIDGWFLDLWREQGGINAFGYPITAEITRANGSVIQYYQYARFEYWPNGDANGNQLVLGRIGEELHPVMVPRPALGATASTSSELTKAALAWLPLTDDQIQPDTDTYRFVPETGHSVQDGFKRFWEATGEQWYLGYPLSEAHTIGGVRFQVFERGKLRWEPDGDVRMMPVGKMLADRYSLPQTPLPQGNFPTYSESLFIPPVIQTPAPAAPAAPPPPPGYEKSIVVSLSQQRLWAYERDTVVISSLVSTGREGFRTPPGTYFVIYKLPVEDMEGVIGGEYYNVPQVPDVMYFTGVGHAIHGAYWHSNFGTPMSHGCVNLPLDVSKALYDWTPSGTPVVVVN